jgi:N-acetylneuraminic acid mutarotase
VVSWLFTPCIFCFSGNGDAGFFHFIFIQRIVNQLMPNEMKTITRIVMIINLFFPLLLLSQGVWIQKANYLGTSRYEFIGYSLGSKGYMGAGTYGGINSFLGDLQEFDPVSNTWTQKAPLPMPFKGGIGFAAGSYGYAATGANDAMFIADTYEYNPFGNNWSTKAPFVMVRLYSTGIGSGDFGYIIGGYDVTALPMNDCWEYNQQANTWTERASLPVSAARYYSTGFSVNGKIYVFGGTDGNTSLNDLWEFNPPANTWSQKASLPGVGRERANAFVINNEAYIVGGFPPSAGTLKECWRYNPASNQWTRLADFPGVTGPAGGLGFTINGSGYVVCGNGTAECWEFTPYVTGMSDPVAVTGVTVFPNPASTDIYLKMPAGVTCKSASVYSISGKVMQHDIPLGNSDGRIDISNLQSGFYLLRIKTESGTLLNESFIKSED